jgi:hypothetical protein
MPATSTQMQHNKTTIPMMMAVVVPDLFSVPLFSVIYIVL